MTSTVSPQTALIYIMVVTSAADADMTDRELFSIGEIVRTLPIFADVSDERLIQASKECAELLGGDDGLEALMGLVSEALPARLRETAYALACDVAAADGKLEQEELRMLEIIRHRLGLDRLVAAAIERAARARYFRPS